MHVRRGGSRKGWCLAAKLDSSPQPRADNLIYESAELYRYVQFPQRGGRLRHPNLDSSVTELAEPGISDATLMSIACHMSRRMLEHYSHIRMAAKRQAVACARYRIDEAVPHKRKTPSCSSVALKAPA